MLRWRRCEVHLGSRHSSQLRDFASSPAEDRKSTRLNSSHLVISYAVFCLKKERYFPFCPAATSAANAMGFLLVRGRDGDRFPALLKAFRVSASRSQLTRTRASAFVVMTRT